MIACKMSGPPSLKSLVCEEVFDERSQPSEEEVREYAAKIGINPEKEAHLLPLAREGLLRPLPKNWKPVFDPETKQYYYFNFKTKQSSWEHPLDSKFRDLVKKSRSESLSSAGEEDSKTSIKEELKSFEEAAASIGLEADSNSVSKEHKMDLATHGVPTLKTALSPLRSLRKEKGKPSLSKNELKPTFMPKPLFAQSSKDPPKGSDGASMKSPMANWDDLSLYFSDDSEHVNDMKGLKAKGDTNFSTSLDYDFLVHDLNIESGSSSVIGRFTVDRVQKIDIDSQTKRLDKDGQGNLQRASDRFSKSSYGQSEFSLSGGGSIFLKSNKNKKAEEEGDKSMKVNLNLSSKSDIFSDSDFNTRSEEADAQYSTQRNVKSSILPSTSSPIPSPSTRSILRTPQGEKRLWDVNPQHMSVSEKALWKQQELEEEKKSVRFNLDKELNISFKLSDSSEDSTSDVDQVDEEEAIDWNLRGSDDLQSDLQAHQLHNVGKSDLPTKKEKHLSPLEEWAKKTWFSKTSSSELKGVEEAQIPSKSIDNDTSSNYDLPTSSHSKIVNESTGNQSFGSGDTQISSQSKETADFLQKSATLTDAEINNQDNASYESNNVPSNVSSLQCIPQNQTLLDRSGTSSNNTVKKLASPTEDPSQSEAERNLVASITRKLKSINTGDQRSSEDGLVRAESAREQAYRDWNVKINDGEMYRPPMSRQQSQQQMIQMKQQIQEPSRVGDRDRALRAWNVTDKLNDQSGKRSPKDLEKELFGEESAHAVPDCNVDAESSPVHRARVESSLETQIVFSKTEKKMDSVSGQQVLRTAAEGLENKLKSEIDKLETEFQVKLKSKKEEYKNKFEIEQQEIVRDYKEKLQIRIEEETKANDLKFKELISQMERESETRMRQIREQLEHKQKCTSQQILEQHQQALAAQEVENQAAMFRFREQHCAEIKALREQFQREEEQVRREHQDRIVNLREDRDGKRSREITDYLRTVEKLRCEKRLVEDKYRTLKEKYIKLKGEMKTHVEKKEQKQKENLQGDEKGKSSPPNAPELVAAITPQAQLLSDRSSETESKPKPGSAGSSATSSYMGFQQLLNQQEPLNPVIDPPPPAPNTESSGAVPNIANESSDANAPFLGRNFSKLPLGGKQCLTERNGTGSQPSWCNLSHIKSVERNGNMPSTSHENPWSNQEMKDRANNFTPLEALRHQLRTLDELEEQFPVSSVTDAYLRYPFTDAGSKELESAELEFFRHRIHLERDMIRQAKTSLHAQQSEYRSRMHNFHQRQSSTSSASPSTTLFQMAKEEQELSDMEAKLRRTRTILSEKMIHLRHLENSLNRLTAPDDRFKSPNNQRVNEKKYGEKPRFKNHRRWDWKSGGGLGIDEGADDVSSDSGGSSGFSSTEYTSDSTLATLLNHSGGTQKLRRTVENTSDINESLRNLNAEISEIWNVLCKQRAAAGLGPPPLLNTQTAAWASPTNHHSETRAGSPLVVTSLSKVTTDKGSTLIERTNNLRQWLQKAKISATQPNSVLASDKNVVSF